MCFSSKEIAHQALQRPFYWETYDVFSSMFYICAHFYICANEVSKNRKKETTTKKTAKKPTHNQKVPIVEPMQIDLFLSVSLCVHIHYTNRFKQNYIRTS